MTLRLKNLTIVNQKKIFVCIYTESDLQTHEITIINVYST